MARKARRSRRAQTTHRDKYAAKAQAAQAASQQLVEQSRRRQEADNPTPHQTDDAAGSESLKAGAR
jgi:hypothetical protein